jgi:hypothetical protein
MTSKYLHGSQCWDPQLFQCGSRSSIFRSKRIRIQGYDDLQKKFFPKIGIPGSPLWTNQATELEKSSALKKERQHSELQNSSFLLPFFFCSGSFYPPGSGSSRPKSIWIRIHNTARRNVWYRTYPTSKKNLLQ